jgi:hypothetical protein
MCGAGESESCMLVAVVMQHPSESDSGAAVDDAHHWVGNPAALPLLLASFHGVRGGDLRVGYFCTIHCSPWLGCVLDSACIFCHRQYWPNSKGS